ncbi:MAG: aminopeptidase P family protein [Verrucomicrobiaceae bacterium]
MRYSPPPSEFFVGNRSRLVKQIKPHSAVIVHANDIYPTNADGVMPFVQNSDIYYLSAVDQEETVLILFPDAPDAKMREMLFIKETTELISIWEGEKLTKQEAADRSGIPLHSVHWLNEFERIFRTVMFQSRRAYLNTNEHARATAEVESRDLRFVRRCQEEFPLHRLERLAPVMHHLRVIKSKTEVELIKEAIRITNDGFHRVARFVKPGVKEYEIEAEMIHEFTRQGSQGFAFPPIIASGKNACCLHYVTNHTTCQDGDLVLCDFGARQTNYNADLTRTIPVNGRYTKRQRAVYNAVLHVTRAATAMLKPGVILKEYHDNVCKVMEEQLIKLKLIKASDVKKQNPDKPLFKKYYMHGTSHHLGLDVHDVGDLWRPIEPGMVFTVEPGIYIREEKLGVRLENDVLITKKGAIDLMKDVPIEADEIEDLMAKAGK